MIIWHGACSEHSINYADIWDFIGNFKAPIPHLDKEKYTDILTYSGIWLPYWISTKIAG